MSPETAIRILLAAKTLLEKGWYQHKNTLDVEGRVVAYDVPGAVYQVTAFSDAIFTILREHIPQNIYALSLSIWNDEPNRTKAEVLDLFERAIKAEFAKIAKGYQEEISVSP